MSVASILVHVDNSAASESRFNLAIRLAQQFEAHLEALYVMRPTNSPIFTQMPIGADIIEFHRKTLREEAAGKRRICEEAARAAGIKFEWRTEEGVLIDMLSEYGRYSDLIVLGQHDSNDRKDLSEGAVDHVVLESGTACLVVPYIGVATDSIKNVLIAWNGSMESARAVKDAVPFLENAERVEVLVINPEHLQVEKADVTEARVCAYLARHGVTAQVHTIHNDQIDVGDILLSFASDYSADLVVMGAYGHNRLREKILGGVTRHLLVHMPVPVLMSR